MDLGRCRICGKEKLDKPVEGTDNFFPVLPCRFANTIMGREDYRGRELVMVCYDCLLEAKREYTVFLETFRAKYSDPELVAALLSVIIREGNV